jgi:5-methyltetrahydrofolate--homocysteine methyltransferase
MVKTYKSFLALSGKDKNCAGYIDYAATVTVGEITTTAAKTQEVTKDKDLHYFIVKGLKAEAAASAQKELENNPPLDVINGKIIPALNEVGDGFEKKTVFLPQLLMSAEAASAAFDVIKSKFAGGGNSKKLKIVIATVKGDIHDIGKNIVKTLLENYGFTVIDLGRDVPPEVVVQAAKDNKVQLVGLSALMTTTVTSMEETIKALHAEYPDCKICVGGAVLNEEYASAIKADKYCKDAMETVRYAESLENLLK